MKLCGTLGRTGCAPVLRCSMLKKAEVFFRDTNDIPRRNDEPEDDACPTERAESIPQPPQTLFLF